MTLDELIPAIDLLSRSEKIHLMQIVLQQLAQVETDSPASPAAEHFDPKRFYGIAHHSRQAVDQYLVSAREGWN